MCLSSAAWLTVVGLLGTWALASPAVAGDVGPEAATARTIMDVAGVQGGLCLHLGCGRADSPGLTAALAEGSGMLVHGLALDDAALARARTAIEARAVAGPAMVEKLVAPPLPYLPDLAKLVVVEDMSSLAAAGISRDELLRVLAPDGSLCVQTGGKWSSTIKPRPQEMDEWTHPHHGPDENMVSSEKAISFPLDLRWMDGVPVNRGGWAACASCRAWVVAGGRCFTVNNDELGSQETAILKARDAYSGFPLWKFDCEGVYGKTELDWRNVWPLVAGDRRLYTSRKNELLIMDAATGKIEVACPTRFQPRRLFLSNGVLVAACWEKMEVSKEKDGFESDGIRAVWWPSGAGSVETFDAVTGKPKWTLPLSALTIAAADGVVYILTSAGNPPTERTVVAVDLATGREKWRVPHTAFGAEPDTCLSFVAPGCVVISKSKAKGKDPRNVFVLAATDGKILYSIANSVARCIVGNELWCVDGRYDLKTGAKTPGPGLGGNWASLNVLGGCTPLIVFADGKYMSNSRGGQYLHYADDPTKPPTKLSYLGARGACIEGMVPANGMFYTAQNDCNCFPSQNGGFIAVGPGGEIPPPATFQKPRPVETGPAFDAVHALGGASPAADDWPAYRHDSQRSAGTSANVPDVLKPLWKVQAVKPGDGMFAEAWNARTGSPQPLTAPIVASGLVVVAALNSGEIVALSPATGALVWKTPLGSRIDTPPTCCQGQLLVGCHDGWAYALRASDGVLAYRVRIAPCEKRMIAHGLVESVWPTVGAVLVHDGLAYAIAGRSTANSGGIALVAFKPASGQTVWAKCLDATQPGLIDALAVRDGELAWHYLRMDPKTGEFLQPTQRYANYGSMIDGSWMAGYTMRSCGGHVLGRISENMMAWNDNLVITLGSAVARSKADVPKPAGKSFAAAKHPDPFKPDELAWSNKLEPETAWARVYAMALSGNTAFYAGSVYVYSDPKRPGGGNFLWMNATATGKKQQDPIKFDAPPVLDGLAVAAGRLYLVLQDGTVQCLGTDAHP